MKKPFFLFGIISLALLTISCASPMEKKLFSEVNPKFDGIVTPIDIPIQLEYKPASGNFKVDIIVGVIFKSLIFGNKKNSFEMDASGNFHISQLDDSLIWNVKITRMKTENKIFTPTLPIVDARLFTNKSGIIEESEISLPAIDKIDMTESEGKKLYDDLKDIIKDFNQGLPQTPVQSGDVLTQLMESNEIEEIVKKMREQDYSLTLKEREFTDINLILKGWSYYQNRKVFVGAINDSLMLKARNPELTIHLKIIGYSLFDWKLSFQ